MTDQAFVVSGLQKSNRRTKNLKIKKENGVPTPFISSLLGYLLFQTSRCGGFDHTWCGLTKTHTHIKRSIGKSHFCFYSKLMLLLSVSD